MEYQYVAYVACFGEALRYATGWWESIDKAKAEIEQMLENALPAGLYNISMNLKQRRIAL